MTYEPPSKLQKLHFHLFWDAIKTDDTNVFFIFIQIDINGKCKLYMQLQNHFVVVYETTSQIIYINSISLCVCDGGFGGWGKGEACEVAGDFFS